MKYIMVDEWRNTPKVFVDAITLPEAVERATETQRARNVTMGIYKGNATAAGMGQLLDGDNVKDTVK